MIFNNAITGEQDDFDVAAPQAVLNDFYHAFNSRDMIKMAANWLQTDEVSMSNPLGGVRRGWQEIEPVYQRLFSGSARVYVEFYDYSIHRDEQFFCAVGRERGYFQHGDTKIDLAIRTSRIFRFDSGHWMQLHHHGSIESAELLQAYQSAVVKKVGS